MRKLGTLGSSAAVIALALGAPTMGIVIAPQQAHADECILDSNNNGVADAADTDGGASSAGVDDRLACGVGATASTTGATAVGHNSTAGGTDAISIGNESDASNTS